MRYPRKRRVLGLRTWRREALAIALATVATLDNATTWLAVSRGARELNPIISLLLNDVVVWWLFTVGKAVLSYVLVKKTYNENTWWFLGYAVVFTLFARATVVNFLNYLTLGL